MICLIIKTPLANDEIRPSVLYPFDHIRKLLLLVLSQVLVLLYSRYIEFMFCFGPWGFEWASKDGYAGVRDRVWHLRVGHVFVNEYTLDECCVCERTANFAVYFDEIERDIAPFKVGYLQDGIDSNLCKLSMLFRDAGIVALDL
jgi:hypothetical protein